MDSLVRKALLGDKQAQEECTEKGIVLPCPFCGGEANLRNDGLMEYKIKTAPNYAGFYIRWEIKCKECGFLPDRLPAIVEYNFNNERGELEIVGDDFRLNFLKEWNTRPAPPIGRCGECKYSLNDDEYGKAWCNRMTGTFEVKSDDYCSYFKPREEE